MSPQAEKVCLIGSGNWGSAVATLIGQNCERLPNQFQPEISMYVYEEQVMYKDPNTGEEKLTNLTEVINNTHMNTKYLPNIKLPNCIKAVPDLETAAKDATLLIWVVPHQFVNRMIPSVKKVISPNASSISLIKGGIDIKNGEIELCSDLIRSNLNHPTMVLMGANLADEVARGDFCEATIGYSASAANDKECANVYQTLFTTPTFSVQLAPDVPGVELCGALKNIVALGAGFVDGLGYGCNTKAAAIRIGLGEMKKFISMFYPGNDSSGTMFESCGVADLITTCFGGRNRKCSEAFVKSRVEGAPKTWEEIEKEMLNGQKLQGTLTCEEIVGVLEKRGKCDEFPFFMNIFKIAFQNQDAKETLFKGIK